MTSVLVINYEYPPIGAGAANATFNIATAMAKRGNRVCVVTSAFGDNRGQTDEDNVTVFRLPAARRHVGRSSLFQMLMYVAAAVRWLPSIIKKHRPDAAIIFFAFPCGPIGLLLKYRWRIPYLLMLRGGDVPGFESSLTSLHRFLRPIRREIYRKSFSVIANSDGLKKLASEADPGYDIQMIPNGVDTEFYCPASITVKIEKAYTFLFVGRFCAQKNLLVLLDAFAACRTRHPEIRLVLIGDGPDGESLKAQAEQIGISSSLFWGAWCDKRELLEHYRSAHCFVNPSINEGMSNAVLEAMACSLPVLAGDCIGNRELITDNVNGFLFDPRRHKELSVRMSELIADTHRCRALGEKGRKICTNQYSWPAVVDKISLIINNNLLSDRGGNHS